MRIAVTGATGFLGRYIVNHLLGEGHECRCWYRETSDRGGFDEHATGRLAWVPGDLGDAESADRLVEHADAVVHSALYRPGAGFRGAEGDLVVFAERNVLGTLRLMEAARRAKVGRFVFISTCAVHEKILEDRALDEAHPLWPTSHYGAHKAAIEKFVHSYGLGGGWEICALRPTGIYGLARPAEASRWYDLIRGVAAGQPVHSPRGGKEVHALDVARAVGILLKAPGVAGQAYNCYDRYVSEEEVARIARDLTGGKSEISNLNQGPRNEIVTDKLRALGMTFGGQPLLEQTVRQLLSAAQASPRPEQSRDRA
ncbi:MAG: NAD(P)-dependent oxidoreductase [Phycisphaerae bacterium]|nr:NAD(P)-dependent oxidoreductase [Phycisphaerae bacterium]